MTDIVVKDQTVQDGKHRQHTAFKLHKNCIKSKNDAERSSLTEKYGFYE